MEQLRLRDPVATEAARAVIDKLVTAAMDRVVVLAPDDLTQPDGADLITKATDHIDLAVGPPWTRRLDTAAAANDAIATLARRASASHGNDPTERTAVALMSELGTLVGPHRTDTHARGVPSLISPGRLAPRAPAGPWPAGSKG